MNSIRIESELSYNVISPTSFVFNITGMLTDRQKVFDEKLFVSQNTPVEWCLLNEFGTRGLRLKAETGDLKVHYSANVQLSPEVECANVLDEVVHKALPAEVLKFLNPSRYCESDRLNLFASKEFGHLEGGYFRVKAICDWIYHHIDYVAGSTDESSSACDVLIQRAGVCRDFAHVGISLCRALGIPARYVAGYAVGLEPPDFHGFFEVYLDENWYMFDTTKLAPVNGFVRVGVGRDAADTSFSNIVGRATFSSMRVSAIANDPLQQSTVGDAISTA